MDNITNAPVEDQSVNYHSTVIPYLDHPEESAKSFINTRDEVLFERQFEIQTILNISNQVRLLQTKYFVVIYLLFILY